MWERIASPLWNTDEPNMHISCEFRVSFCIKLESDANMKHNLDDERIVWTMHREYSHDDDIFFYSLRVTQFDAPKFSASARVCVREYMTCWTLRILFVCIPCCAPHSNAFVSVHDPDSWATWFSDLASDIETENVWPFDDVRCVHSKNVSIYFEENFIDFFFYSYSLRMTRIYAMCAMAHWYFMVQILPNDSIT